MALNLFIVDGVGIGIQAFRCGLEVNRCIGKHSDNRCDPALFINYFLYLLIRWL